MKVHREAVFTGEYEFDRYDGDIRENKHAATIASSSRRPSPLFILEAHSQSIEICSLPHSDVFDNSS